MVFQVLGTVVDAQPGRWQVWSRNRLNKPQQVRLYPGPTRPLHFSDGRWESTHRKSILYPCRVTHGCIIPFPAGQAVCSLCVVFSFYCFIKVYFKVLGADNSQEWVVLVTGS